MNKKSLIIVILAFLIVPQVTFAAWWNPITWFNNWTFHKKDVAPQVQVEMQKTPEEKITELEKQVDDLKKQQTNPPTATTLVKTPVGIHIPTIQIDSDGNPLNPNLDYSKYTVNGQVLSPQDYANYLVKKDTTPYVNLKVNDQDGPITVKVNSLVNVSWTSANVVSCLSSTKDKPLNGRETIQIDNNTTSPFTIRCLTSNGVVVSDSVALNITGKTPYNDDPYGVLYGTGNAYTPEQLNAIECAYYGRNCPTLHIKIDN